MIREAEIKDIDKVVELGVEFARKSQPVHMLSVSVEKIKSLAQKVIQDKTGGTVGLVLEIRDPKTELVSIEGFIFGGVLQTYFSEDLILQELALYSRKGIGTGLLNALEEYARRKCIHKILVGSKPAFCDLKSVYLHRGYRLVEEQFLKEV